MLFVVKYIKNVQNTAQFYGRYIFYLESTYLILTIIYDKLHLSNPIKHNIGTFYSIQIFSLIIIPNVILILIYCF